MLVSRVLAFRFPIVGPVTARAGGLVRQRVWLVNGYLVTKIRVTAVADECDISVPLRLIAAVRRRQL